MNCEEKERAKAGQPVQDETNLPNTSAVTDEASEAGFYSAHKLLHVCGFAAQTKSTFSLFTVTPYQR